MPQSRTTLNIPLSQKPKTKSTRFQILWVFLSKNYQTWKDGPLLNATFLILGLCVVWVIGGNAIWLLQFFTNDILGFRTIIKIISTVFSIIIYGMFLYIIIGIFVGITSYIAKNQEIHKEGKYHLHDGSIYLSDMARLLTRIGIFLLLSTVMYIMIPILTQWKETYILNLIISLGIFLVSSFFIDRSIKNFFKNQSEKFRSFFEEVQSYHDLISHDLTPGERGDASYPFSVEKGISDILQESENIQTKTKELIQKRRYAWFVFDTPSYRSYKQMIHERIEAMIPLLQKQKMLLQETIEQEQSTLLQAQHTLQDTLTPIPSLQYTAEVQNQRLEKQIQEFEKLRRVVG